jgi:hypothetical protein
VNRWIPFGTGGGASTFAELTDKATADLPTINTPLSQALAGKAPSSGIAPSAITGTAVVTNDARLSDARTPTSHTHVSADITDATSDGATNPEKVLKTDANGQLTVALLTVGPSDPLDGGQVTFSATGLQDNRSYGIPDAPTGNLSLTARTDGVPDALIGTLTATAYTETVVALDTVGASATIAITGGTVITATLTSSTPCTFTMPTAAAGKSFIFHLKQAATPTTATFTDVLWSGGATYAATQTAGRVDILSFVTTPNDDDDGYHWVGSVIPNITLP